MPALPARSATRAKTPKATATLRRRKADGRATITRGSAARPPENVAPSPTSEALDPARWAQALWQQLSQPLAPGAPPGGNEALAYRVDPARLLELQNDYTRGSSKLWQAMVEGRPLEPAADKRFGSAAWQGTHAYLAHGYLLAARFMTQLAESIEADAKTRAKVRFAVGQWVDAMAPSNFLATNPDAQQKILASKGESLAASFANMLADLQKGRISQTDETAFEVGRNIGVTPGAVVFQNEIFQLLQYRPTTATVFEKPLLIVPPCINKFYILDLQPENSFVASAVAAGHTVFLVSWRNAGRDQAALNWDDYVEHGVIRAIALARHIAQVEQINILGFCIGGTLTATALAVLAARGEQPASALTLLTTLLDFSETGILDVFVDEQHVRLREQTIGGVSRDGVPAAPPGLMPGRDLAASFSFLRPNELVWNYVVNSYLKGEAPPPFDLLYWNSDSTNLPGPFFVWYLRNTYLEDKLKRPDALTVCGVPVDLGRVRIPSYVYGSREDHIVPWTAAYANTALLKGPTRFVLGASGHIAGVINPPAKNKRAHWIATDPRQPCPKTAQDWLAQSREVPGSWWPDWQAWLAPFSGARRPAPKKLGGPGYAPLEDAPGSYVRARAE